MQKSPKGLAGCCHLFSTRKQLWMIMSAGNCYTIYDTYSQQLSLMQSLRLSYMICLTNTKYLFNFPFSQLSLSRSLRLNQPFWISPSLFLMMLSRFYTHSCFNTIKPLLAWFSYNCLNSSNLTELPISTSNNLIALILLHQCLISQRLLTISFLRWILSKQNTLNTSVKVIASFL